MTKQETPSIKPVTKQKRQKYYKVISTSRITLKDFKLANEDIFAKDNRGLYPKIGWPEGVGNLANPPWRLPDILESPQIVISPRAGKVNMDFIGYSSRLFVSEKARDFLLLIAKGECEFVKCETRFARLKKTAPSYWLFNLKSALTGTVDFESSVVGGYQEGVNGRLYGTGLYTGAVQLDDGKIGERHIFRLIEDYFTFYCDEYFRTQAVKEKITGLRFFRLDQRDADGNLKFKHFPVLEAF